ncbi:MAG TPA: hypothetical protein VHB48_09425, partial [Chitinophagaceae bacterium]|nr:hypothetical protein [Chitinophagaceae bacterium]
MQTFLLRVIKVVFTVSAFMLPAAALAQPGVPIVSGNLSICSGSSATLTASGDAGATFAWYSDAAGVNLIAATATYVTPVLTSNATYYVQQIVNNTGSAIYQVVVTVNSNPSVSAGNNIITCPGTGVTLTASGADTYSWQPGNLSGASVSVTPGSTTT